MISRQNNNDRDQFYSDFIQNYWNLHQCLRITGRSTYLKMSCLVRAVLNMNPYAKVHFNGFKVLPTMKVNNIKTKHKKCEKLPIILNEELHRGGSNEISNI